MTRFRHTRYDVQPQAWDAVHEQLDRCRRQLRAVETAGWRLSEEDGHPSAEEELAAEKEALSRMLLRAHRRLVMLLEQLELPVFLEEYLVSFRKLEGALGDTEHAEWDPETQVSEPLNFLARTLADVEASLAPSEASTSIDAVAQIEGILRLAPTILARVGIAPTSEKHVEEALFEFIRLVHPSARKQVELSQVVKSFKADIGIDSLGVLIEVKFVTSERETRKETPGIFEDMFGYRGDPGWRHHFALIYCSDHSITQGELEAQFERSGCPVDWTPVVVHGTGSRRTKTVRSAKGSRSRKATGTAR